MTTAKRPDLPEFLGLTFSPEAASALTDTNTLARQLRDMPENLFTPELKDDRDRVLGEHLSDLLAAHRDARAAGAASADAELVDGLEHVREELARIIAACQARAKDTLSTQSRFLETRYPAAVDDVLTALPEPSAPVDAKPIAGGLGEPRKLPPTALDALLPAKARPVPASPVTPPASSPDWMDAKGWNSDSIIAVVVGSIAGIGLLGAVIYGAQREFEEADIAAAFPAKVAVSLQLDSVKRGPAPEDISGMNMVAVAFHGSIANNADLEARRVKLAIDVTGCPKDSPAASCKLLDTTFYDPTNEARVPAGLTTRFRHTEQITVPDIDGDVRARVRLVGVSPYDEFRD